MYRFPNHLRFYLNPTTSICNFYMHCLLQKRVHNGSDSEQHILGGWGGALQILHTRNAVHDAGGPEEPQRRPNRTSSRFIGEVPMTMSLAPGTSRTLAYELPNTMSFRSRRVRRSL